MMQCIVTHIGRIIETSTYCVFSHQPDPVLLALLLPSRSLLRVRVPMPFVTTVLGCGTIENWLSVLRLVFPSPVTVNGCKDGSGGGIV